MTRFQLLVTNSDGETTFNFRGVHEGTYNVTMEAGGVTRTVPISVTANSGGLRGGQGGTVSAPALPATRAGQTTTVNITATDESGVFVPKETIRIRSTGGLGGLSSGTTVETSADGVASFQFNETRAGNYTVEFTDESGEINGTTTVSVTADSEGAVESGAVTNARTPVGIEGKNATLELLATDQYGNPVPSTNVTIKSPREELNGKTATTDSSGVAVINYTETKPGKYPVEVKFAGDKNSAKSSVVVEVYENLDVDRSLETDTHLIHGTVTHSNGVRADGGRVTVVKADGSHRQNVLIDADGNYEVAVPAGNYRVIVDTPGSPRAIEEVNAVQANPDPAHLTLDNSGTIAGRVTDQQKAAGNLPVQIRSERRTYYSKTNNSGTFELDISPGTYVVAPLGTGAGLGSREVTVTAGDILPAVNGGASHKDSPC